MPLQNFVDNSLPTIKAAWLNSIDSFYTTLFGSATTAAAARAAIAAAASGANADITSINGTAIPTNKTLLVSTDIGTTVQGYVAPGTAGNLLTSDGVNWTSAAPAAATTIPPGTVADYLGSTAPTSWLLLSGLTIGDGSSGATARANADTLDLYTVVWNSMTDTEAPVSGGRGASAAADFAAHKTLTLPDARGRVIAGKDNMGGSTASRITNAGSGIVGTTLGTAGGLQTHTLTTAQLASHSHDGVGAIKVTDGAGALAALSPNNSATIAGGNLSQAQYMSTVAAGSGDPHPNVQPTLVLNKIVKL